MKRKIIFFTFPGKNVETSGPSLYHEMLYLGLYISENILSVIEIVIFEKSAFMFACSFISQNWFLP